MRGQASAPQGLGGLPQLLDAQVIKVARWRRLIEMRHRVVFGAKAAMDQVLAACGWQINISFVESLHLNLRQHVGVIG